VTECVACAAKKPRPGCRELSAGSLCKATRKARGTGEVVDGAAVKYIFARSIHHTELNMR